MMMVKNMIHRLGQLREASSLRLLAMIRVVLLIATDYFAFSSMAENRSASKPQAVTLTKHYRVRCSPEKLHDDGFNTLVFRSDLCFTGAAGRWHGIYAFLFHRGISYLYCRLADCHL